MSSVIKVFRREGFYLRVDNNEDDRLKQLVASLEDKFTYMMYKEAACSKCPYLEDRHGENCDSCQNFLGARATGGIKDMGSRGVYLKVPRSQGKLLLAKIKSHGLSGNVKLLDRRPEEKPMKKKVKLLPGISLRDYQVTAVEIMTKPSGVCGVLKSPPRTGKTVMATAAICKLGQKTLILASQTEWLYQFRETFVGSETTKPMTNMDPDLIGFPKSLEDFEKYDVSLCTLSMFKSKRGKLLLEKIRDRFPVIVIDEVHYVPAEGCAKVVAGFNARWIIGLTGSPERKNVAEYKIVEDIVGDIIYEVKTERARPEVHLLEMPKGSKNEFQIKGHGPYAFTSLVSKLEASSARREAICNKAIQLSRQGHLVLIPLTRVKSILDFTTYINKQTQRPGYALPFYGDIKKEKRMEIINAARNYECKVLVGNIALISVGLNIQRASAIIECGINSNAPACKQRIARVLTPMEGKPTPLVVFTLDDSDIMRKCRRTEFYNVIMPEFNPRINDQTKQQLNRYFAAATSSVKSRKGSFSHINPKDAL